MFRRRKRKRESKGNSKSKRLVMGHSHVHRSGQGGLNRAGVGVPQHCVVGGGGGDAETLFWSLHAKQAADDRGNMIRRDRRHTHTITLKLFCLQSCLRV